MRIARFLTTATLVLTATVAQAAQITGEYIEARTCDVYTGPCFANGEMDLAGKEAMMAWQVDEGTWNDVRLDGLGVALVIRSEWTLGDDGIFGMQPGKIQSLIVVDDEADNQQKAALVDFVKDTAAQYTKNLVKVQTAPISLKNDHLDGKGLFKAGDMAEIQTRALKAGDCVCTNEVVYYQPLTDVQNFSPAFSQSVSFQGKALKNKWTAHGTRSAFLATFRR